MQSSLQITGIIRISHGTILFIPLVAVTRFTCHLGIEKKRLPMAALSRDYNYADAEVK